MKKQFSLFVILLVSVVLYSQIQLIPPVVESPAMNKRQAQSLTAFRVFRNWGIAATGIDSLMQLYTGKGVKVCICDTGRPKHTELQPYIAEAANFTSNPTASDGNGHSTHVAGIVSEIAPDAKLYFAKVLSDHGFGSDQGVADGIKWCTEKGANIINLSLGGPAENPILTSAINAAYDAGVTIVAAAGNDGQKPGVDLVGWPAKVPVCIVVGATNEQGAVSWFSSAGIGGDVIAPGEKILSTWLNDQYIVLSGTSMATPFVVGFAALLIEAGNNNTSIQYAIPQTATDVIPDTGYDYDTFFGIINPRHPAFYPVPMDTVQPEPVDTIQPGPVDTIPQEPTPTDPVLGSNPNAWWIFGGIVLVVGVLIFISIRYSAR